MTYETLKTFFLWTTIIHFSVLVFWLLLMRFAGDWFRKQQRRWFPVPEDKFVSFHYLMYGGYKLMVLVFSAVPYLALVLME
jgi:hypothetical protein